MGVRFAANSPGNVTSASINTAGFFPYQIPSYASGGWQFCDSLTGGIACTHSGAITPVDATFWAPEQITAQGSGYNTSLTSGSGGTLTYNNSAVCPTPPVLNNVTTDGSGHVTGFNVVTAGSCSALIAYNDTNWMPNSTLGVSGSGFSAFIDFTVTYATNGSTVAGNNHIMSGMPANCYLEEQAAYATTWSKNIVLGTNYLNCGAQVVEGYDLSLHGGLGLAAGGISCLYRYNNFAIGPFSYQQPSTGNAAAWAYGFTCTTTTAVGNIFDGGGMMAQNIGGVYNIRLATVNTTNTFKYNVFKHNGFRVFSITPCGQTDDIEDNAFLGFWYMSNNAYHGDLMLINNSCSSNPAVSFVFDFNTLSQGQPDGGYTSSGGFELCEGACPIVNVLDISNNVWAGNLTVSQFTGYYSSSLGIQATSVPLTYPGNGGLNKPIDEGYAYVNGVSGHTQLGFGPPPAAGPATTGVFELCVSLGCTYAAGGLGTTVPTISDQRQLSRF